MKKLLIIIFPLLLILFSCDNEPDDPPTPPGSTTDTAYLHFKFKFDSTQTRLDNFGNPTGLPSGHAGQHPLFRKMGAHYIELIPHELTQVGGGEVVYESPKTTAGGDEAIDFQQLNLVGEDEVFWSVPLSEVAAGNYEFIRVSLAYQKYEIDFRANYQGLNFDLTGTLSSFIGVNNYITSYTVHTMEDAVNSNKLQGYWAFEVHPDGFVPASMQRGQAAGTTVVNPIASSSPIPPGSCLVTGEFGQAFSITGNETEDITITISLSTNNSFEWQDPNGNGIYEPLDGETPVDMGIRGLMPIVE